MAGLREVAVVQDPGRQRRGFNHKTNEEDLRFLYPDIEIPKRIRPVLVEYRLTVFRD